jgi:zinc transport system permease protein
MFDAFASAFMQRALLAGVLVSLTASYLGVFVVQRGLSFLGSGLAHAAFGGVALALLLNTEPLWIAVPFTVVVALAITWVTERTTLGGDTSIGVFFSLSVALGVIFLTLKKNYAPDAMTYLFGSLLTIAPQDLWVAGVVLGVTVLTLPLWGRWAYATFDRELAAADRLRVGAQDYALAVLIAVVIVVAAKLVGIMLVSAFLVIPAAAARLVARTFAGMTLLAIIAGLTSTVAGLWLSYERDLPSGAVIVLVEAALFAAAMLFSALRRIGRARAM